MSIDKNFEQTLACALKNSTSLLEKLLGSIALNKDSEAKDCLEVFDQYNWQMTDGENQVEFDRLKQLGNLGEMSVVELNAFMEMTSDEGEHHNYLTIINAEKLVSDNKQMLAGIEGE